MKTVTKTIIWTILTGAAFGGTFILGDILEQGSVTGSSEVRIEEDEPGWDCATMGNLRCN